MRRPRKPAPGLPPTRRLVRSPNRHRPEVEPLEGRLLLHACHIQFSSASYTVDEASGNAVVTVDRVGLPLGDSSVRVSTSDGSALDGQDYTGVNQVLSWADGDSTSRQVVIPIRNDATVEANETFSVRMSEFNGTSAGSPTTAVVTVVDNDRPAGSQDVTGLVAVARGKLHRLPVSRQTLTLTNTGGQVLTGPLTLLLEGLNRKVKLRRAAGGAVTGATSLVVNGDLTPGASLTLGLRFANPQLARFGYAVQVFAAGLR